MPRAAESVGSSVVDSLWLDTLQRIIGRASHEVKGALNGVSVNLEVVRSRGAKPGAPATAVSSFALAAIEQLEGLITMTDAVLSLGRAVREPVVLPLLVSRISALLGPAAHVDGGELTLDGSVEDLGVTSANGAVARLAVGGMLLAATKRWRTVSVSAAITEGGCGVTVRVDGSGEAAAGASVDPEVVTAAADAGIAIVAESSAILISFPR
jgi:hypothetical protein